ncbi:hypothetical protein [Nostoc sp. LPT]|uniref:hypothetical protein n=1 Tax=Nostoc sp. LPT TaxID=2815387 RepID=UPI001E1A4056|nr:hypothetical protein [Nostoc sp. LPT]MBN4000417.1 hypothetical protein [Nostoc sp. LPT]
MQLITVTNGVACRRSQSVSKSWHRILILFKIFDQRRSPLPQFRPREPKHLEEF